MANSKVIQKKPVKKSMFKNMNISANDKPPVPLNIATTQASVPILGLHEKYGLIETYKGCYVKSYSIGDNNYMTAPEEEQNTFYKGYRKLINSFGPTTEFALTINNRPVNQQEFQDSILIKEAGDKFDFLRKQMNTITMNRMNDGKNGIVRDKYLTVAVHTQTARKARDTFNRLDRDINKSLSNISSSATPVSLEEELDTLYTIYSDTNDHLIQKSKVVDDNGHVSESKSFDYNNMRSMGLSINDLIAPSSIDIYDDYIRLGNKYARVLKVSQLPSQLSDEFLTNVTDMPFNCITTINYKPIPPKKSDGIVAKNLSFVRDEKQRAMRAGQKVGVYDDSYVDPAILDRESEALALRDAMHEKDERLFETCITVVIFADSVDKLDEYKESIITEYKKASVTINVMKGQQEEGFNSTLPLCYNQIVEKRTLTSSSSAIFIPFSTLEVSDAGGINYSCNLISKNLIVYDRLSAANFNGFILGTPGCVDKDTEYFNGKEWKPISEYTQGEKVLQYDTVSNEASLVVPQRYIKEKCDKMYHFETTRGIDQTLSSEHRVIYYDRDTHNGGFSKAKEMYAEELVSLQNSGKFRGKFKTDFKFDGKGINLSDVEIKLMLAVIADGSFNKNNPNSYNCAINLKKARKKNELFKLLKEYTTDFRVYETDDGYTHYSFAAPRREKSFSSYWYDCNSSQLHLICENILKWDGHEDKAGRKTFTSTVKETADFVQFAFSACGYRATIHMSDRNGEHYFTNGKQYTRHVTEYTVCISENTMVGMEWHNDGRKNNVMIKEVIPTDGYKYCFTVPTHSLVLRRNGKIFITGNSGKSFSAKQEMLNVFLKSNADIIIIDPEDEYGPLAKSLDGEVVKIVPGGDVHINPLEIVCDYELEDETNPINAKADFILKIMECILESPFGINSIQQTIIDECVHALYDPFVKNGKLRNIPPDKMPTLTDLQILLGKRPEPEARELSMALKLYSGEGSLNTFGFRTNVHIDNRFTVYQIRDIGDRLKPLAMLTILDHIWNKIVENRKIGKNTWFYVDEIYLLFMQSYSASFLNTLFRRARKYGGVPTGLTQNVSPLLESPVARDMLEHTLGASTVNSITQRCA